MDMDLWYDLVVNDLEHLIDVTEPVGTEGRRAWPPAREPMGGLAAISATRHGAATRDVAPR